MLGYGFSSKGVTPDRGNVGIGIESAGYLLEIVNTAIGATQSDIKGVILRNDSIATSGTVQASPAFILEGQAYGTTLAKSQKVTFRQDVLPISGAGAAGTWQLASSTNGGAYTTQLTVTTAGVLTSTGDIVRSGFTAGGNNMYHSSHIVVGVANGNSQFYRTTNAGSDLVLKLISTTSLTGAGTQACILDGANNNGFILAAGNGTRQIARAAITITNLTNTAASEAADLILLTQSAGGAMSEKVRITAVGLVGIGLTPTKGYLEIKAGTTTAAPLILTSGTNNTTAQPGAFEYNGTNLFFTRTGTTRENVLIAVDGATAPTTSVGVGIVNFYGAAATNFLGDPNRWMSINILGTVYKIPMYT